MDCYLLNNSYKGGFRITSIGKDQRPVRDEVGGDKLFLNDKGKFIDISEKAGIYGSVIGFGLGVSIQCCNMNKFMIHNCKYSLSCHARFKCIIHW